jgi:hypothetical protein
MEEYSDRCIAFGCRNKGTMSHSTHKSEGWLCNLHFFADFQEWPQITRQINLGLLQLPIQSRRASECAPGEFATYEKKGDYKDWARRIVANRDKYPYASLAAAEAALNQNRL